MQFGKPLTALALVFALGLGAPVMAQDAHDHGAHDAAVADLVLNEGAKWEGDQNMITGMEAIRATMAANLDAIHANTLAADAAQDVSTEVMTQVEFMIENCELEPAADEQFHLVLAQVMDGALTLDEGEVEPGGLAIIEALDAYGEHFEHPDWEPLTH